MKRIALLMISLLLCFAAGAAAENTQPAPDETYECGDYAYILLEDGSAEVTGYAGAASKLEVPGELDGYPVTTIGDSAFWECDSLTDITLPDSVTTIGDAAFYWCKSLTDITIPDSVTSIGDSAFGLCDSLTSITLPDSVTSIGDSAFYGCNSLILTVGRDSYAKQYAVENGIQYTYPDANNWLYE